MPTKLVIDGKLVDAQSRSTFANVGPRDSKTLAEVAEGDAADIDRGNAEAPEDVVLRDRVLLVLGLLWLVLFGLGALGV